MSLRRYPRFDDIRRMVSRSAYAAAPLFALAARRNARRHDAHLSRARRCSRSSHRARQRWLGLAAWLAMAIVFQPILRLYRRSPLWGFVLPAIAAIYTGFTFDSGDPALARARWSVEGRASGCVGRRSGGLMITATEARSGKGHTDENFPVASRLIQAKHRGPILAFYRFVRAADDIADHPALDATQKLQMLDRLDAALTGRGPPDPEAEPLKAALAERGLSSRHALDLLDAFRMDATKRRYSDWRDLIHYCSSRPCRSAASCSTSTASRHRRHGLRPMRSAPHCR